LGVIIEAEYIPAARPESFERLLLRLIDYDALSSRVVLMTVRSWPGAAVECTAILDPKPTSVVPERNGKILATNSLHVQ
jgi:hypothetical protein